MKPFLFGSICLTALCITFSAQASELVIHETTESHSTTTSHSTTVTDTFTEQTTTSTTVASPLIPDLAFPDFHFPEVSTDHHWPGKEDIRTDRWLLARLKKLDWRASIWKKDPQTVLFRWKGKTILARRSMTDLTLTSWFTRPKMLHQEALNRSNAWNNSNSESRSRVTSFFNDPRLWLEQTLPIESASDSLWGDENLRHAVEEYALLIDDFVRTIDKR